MDYVTYLFWFVNTIEGMENSIVTTEVMDNDGWLKI
jgi:hypothetical protein